MQRGRFSASAEYLVYATNGDVGEGGAKSPQNVVSCPVDRDRQHIAQKPIEVMTWAMGVVPSGAVVLDPFMGSGTTLSAAKSLGYRSIGIEILEQNCEVAAILNNYLPR